jgi:predicted nucleotidyltransferase
MYGMTDDELQLLCSLFARHKEIEQVILFGSRARGTHKPFSDVDITLLGIGLTRSHLNRLMADIDESSLPYSFDISLYAKLTNSDLIEQIERTGVMLYQRGENAFVAEP